MSTNTAGAQCAAVSPEDGTLCTQNPCLHVLQTVRDDGLSGSYTEGVIPGVYHTHATEVVTE